LQHQKSSLAIKKNMYRNDSDIRFEHEKFPLQYIVFNAMSTVQHIEIIITTSVPDSYNMG